MNWIVHRTCSSPVVLQFVNSRNKLLLIFVQLDVACFCPPGSGRGAFNADGDVRRVLSVWSNSSDEQLVVSSWLCRTRSNS